MDHHEAQNSEGENSDFIDNLEQDSVEVAEEEKSEEIVNDVIS